MSEARSGRAVGRTDERTDGSGGRATACVPTGSPIIASIFHLYFTERAEPVGRPVPACFCVVCARWESICFGFAVPRKVVLHHPPSGETRRPSAHGRTSSHRPASPPASPPPPPASDLIPFSTRSKTFFGHFHAAHGGAGHIIYGVVKVEGPVCVCVGVFGRRHR